MSKGLRVLAIAAMVLALICGASFAADWGAFNSPYMGVYARTKLVGGKTTRDSYTNGAITAFWDFESSTKGKPSSLSQTLTFNADTTVNFFVDGVVPVDVKSGDTKTFTWPVGAGNNFYSNSSFELYSSSTTVPAGQTAISGMPFKVEIDGATVTGTAGLMHSVREMVDSMCVPMIEPVGDGAITAVKWAFVRSPDFATPVKRIASNDVSALRLFEFRARNEARYPRYRCWLNKDFANGEELRGELKVADLVAGQMQIRKSIESSWEAFTGQSIPLDLTSCEIRVRYAYGDGTYSYKNASGDIGTATAQHTWCFVDEGLTPEVPVEQGNVHPTFTDTAIKSADCTGTNAEVPGDLEDAKIAPSKPGETNAVKNVVATVTIKVDYDAAAVSSNTEITVKIDGDYSSLAGRLSNLFALIQNNDDKKYHKFPILSANEAGLSFKLPVKGFFSEKVITIAELETTEQKTSSSSSSCAAGALAPLALAALAVIGRRKK